MTGHVCTRGNELIVGAVEVRGTAAGRVRLQVVPDASAFSLAGLIQRLPPSVVTEAQTAVATEGTIHWRSQAGVCYRLAHAVAPERR